MAIRREEALEYHAKGRPGKIQVSPTKPFKNQHDLSLAYTPGVAEPCREIAERPDDVYAYTARGNLVAVVTNGTAVLGLGDIGPRAAKPVMEGKALLFKAFADLDVFDLEVGSKNPDDLIHFCRLLEPTVGGINLEDIRSPDCFYVEEQLRATLSIPVFHDDQHGTAIISGAALLNALEIVGKTIGSVRVVFAGAGAAAQATALHYERLGVEHERIVMCDQHGVLHAGRTDLDPYKKRFVSGTKARTLGEALVGADVFVGLSTGGIVTGEMLAGMAPRPVVFALANPTPEIMPDEARRARPDAVVATGRSDFANQVNNVLGFPFIFRGALDVRARAINEQMELAATRALAALAKQEVPDSVTRAYGLEQLHFGPDYLIPKPFDPRVLLWVAPAVAWAAVASGVAGRTIDEEEYRAELEARLGRAREVMRGLSARAQRAPQRIVFPEGTEPRIVRAARALTDEGTAIPILLGDAGRVREQAHAVGVTLDGIELIDPRTAPDREALARELWERRRRKGITLREARARAEDPMHYALLTLGAGRADAVVAGEDTYYPDAIRPALEIIGAEPGRRHVSGIYMLVFPQHTLFCADCTVNIDPTAETLAEIASATAQFVRRLGIEPRVAMLSFSNFGSVRHPAVEKVRQAVALLHEQEPGLEVDGEMQADTAVVERLLTQTYPFARLKAPANVLIFPNLDAANISYKLLDRLGGAQAIGPILVGMAKPVHILQRGAEVSDIVNMAVIAAVDAQEHRRGTPSPPAGSPP
ncbi:MAG TPA: NADP-dependent malic enzyme [Gemmatimonadales bacterium]|nr:NADP-dependent malic enzyme [Gemmatimonadales bacterium]